MNSVKIYCSFLRSLFASELQDIKATVFAYLVNLLLWLLLLQFLLVLALKIGL